MQLIVLGVGRSGTSLLTGLLNMTGLHVGSADALMAAGPANPKGFWERQDVTLLDSEILAAAGVDWHRPYGFAFDRIAPDRLQEFQRRAAEIVRKLDAAGPWVVKDPRMCLVLPLWRAVLTAPTCVFIVRRPIQVAQSLARFFELPIPIGLALWEIYTLSALEHSRGLPRLLVSHQELIDRPLETLFQLLQKMTAMGAQGLHLPSAEEVKAFLDPQLVRARGDAMLEEQYLTPPQSALLAALERGDLSALDPVPPLSPGARDLLAAYAMMVEAITNLTAELEQYRRGGHR
jgi:hypothetical protein